MWMLKGKLLNVNVKVRDKAAEPDHKVDNCPKRVILCGEYVAHRTAERKASIASKSTPQNEVEENLDDKSLCPLEVHC